MTKRVGRHVLGDPGPLDVSPENLPRPHPRKRFAAGVQEEDALAASLLEPRAQLAQIRRHRANGRTSDWYQPFLAPLSEDADQLVFEQRVADAECDPFGYAETGAVCQLEHGAVTKDERVVEGGRGEQAFDLLHRENVRQRAPPLRRLEALAGIAYDDAVRQEEAEVGSDRGDVPAYGAWG